MNTAAPSLVPLSDDWKKNESAIKAIQVAFDLDGEIGRAIRKAAAESDLTPSAQIRKMLGLPIKMPKRPRLTTSLNEQDYTVLGQRFDIDPNNKIAIRHKIVEELASLAESVVVDK